MRPLLDGRTWILIGFAGQALFTFRFLAQWIVSERAHRSTVPVAFWWLSLLCCSRTRSTDAIPCSPSDRGAVSRSTFETSC